MKKVFCIDCIYRKNFDWGAEVWDECYHPEHENSKRDYLMEWKTHTNCEDANKNNCCHYFEERKSFWKRLINLLRLV